MIMKSKLRSILGGVIPNDADYARLVAVVPDAIDDSNRHLTYYAKNSVPAWEIQLLSHIRNAAKKSQLDEAKKTVPVDNGEDENENESEEEDDDDEDEDEDDEDDSEDDEDDEDEDGDDDDDSDSDSDPNSDQDTDPDAEMDPYEGSATFLVGAAINNRVSEAMEELEKAGLEAGRKL